MAIRNVAVYHGFYLVKGRHESKQAKVKEMNSIATAGYAEHLSHLDDPIKIVLLPWQSAKRARL